MLDLQLDTLFTRDAHGHLVQSREVDPRPAPRLFLGRSAAGNVWALRGDLDARTESRASELCSAEPAPEELGRPHPPACREELIACLSPVTAEWRGPAYVLPDGLRVSDRVKRASTAQVRSWLESFATWPKDATIDPAEPFVFAFSDGEPAALCHSACATSRAAEAGVETRPEFRGRGLAAEATAGWAQAIQTSGRVALYSTSWDNAGSMGVARRLGARLYGEDWHLT